MNQIKIDRSKFQVQTHTRNAITFKTFGNVCGSDSLPHALACITSQRYDNYNWGYDIGVKLCDTMTVGDVRTVFNGVSKLTITRLE